MRSEQFDILVVDDDEEDRMMMGEAFADLDCHNRVTMYDSSVAFHTELSVLRQLTPLPLLIVLDYNMPGEDGSVLLVLLKSDPLLRTIPVVIYTNGLSRTQEQDCQIKGALRCFGKGSTYEEVVSFCKQVCKVAFEEQTL